MRGGIPFALFNGFHFIPAYLMCVAINALVAPLLFLFLGTLNNLLLKWGLYKRFFDKVIERARKKVKQKVEKYGYWGLSIFVAIPLPITGAYTGALGAWILGMERKKSIMAITIGVMIAGIIVTTVFFLVKLLGIEFLKIFYKEV